MRPFQPRNTVRARQLRNEATPAERLLWRYLSRSQLGVRFNRQMPVGPYFADFLCRELALVVELDGWSHEARAEHDTARDRWMIAHGFRVLRYSNTALRGDPESVVAAIREEVAALLQRRAGPPRCD